MKGSPTESRHFAGRLPVSSPVLIREFRSNHVRVRNAREALAGGKEALDLIGALARASDAVLIKNREAARAPVLETMRDNEQRRVSGAQPVGIRSKNTCGTA